MRVKIPADERTPLFAKNALFCCSEILPFFSANLPTGKYSFGNARS